MRFAATAALFALILAGIGCSNGDDSLDVPLVPLASRLVASTTGSPPIANNEDADIIVATSDSSYDAAWAAYGLPGTPPAVDFTTEIVGLIGWGPVNCADALAAFEVSLLIDIAVFQMSFQRGDPADVCPEPAPNVYVIAAERQTLAGSLSFEILPFTPPAP